MPFPSEHAARLKAPGRYERFRRENNKFTSGVDAIWGILPDGKVELQAVRFDNTLFTAAEARKWMSEHKDMGKVILFEAAAQEGMAEKAVRRKAFKGEDQEMIERRGNKWVLLQKHGANKGKVLGTFDTREEALAQERAIEASKTRG